MPQKKMSKTTLRRSALGITEGQLKKLPDSNIQNNDTYLFLYVYPIKRFFKKKSLYYNILFNTTKEE